MYILMYQIQANASRHKAGYEYIKAWKINWNRNIQLLVAAFEDEQEKDQQMDIPEELKRRKDRQAKIKRPKNNSGPCSRTL